MRRRTDRYLTASIDSAKPLLSKSSALLNQSNHTDRDARGGLKKNRPSTEILANTSKVSHIAKVANGEMLWLLGRLLVGPSLQFLSFFSWISKNMYII